MEDKGRVNNQWPSDGHTDERRINRWLHSDFKAVALPYVHPMYEAMISKGSLNSPSPTL
jgi:hypothetical protein